MKEKEQEFSTGFCKVEKRIVMFVTRVSNNEILCCCTCGYMESRKNKFQIQIEEKPNQKFNDYLLKLN